LGYVGDGPQEEPAQWVVSVDYDPGLNVIKRLLHKPDQGAFEVVRERLWSVITSNASIQVVESGGG